ncbi:hypothetical protein GWJ21_14185 [Bacillus coagulans]|uniref:Uncharacterized protein n=1 Tax=Heyndrickxia coagulans TaxID=1398 RepID=A0A150KGT2_HEYCO|nr:hypothetical protein B4099_1680 [Heyndrickxia coagulans]NCG69035.1 hypothetical protein [Heyndrickxia coagulans]
MAAGGRHAGLFRKACKKTNELLPLAPADFLNRFVEKNREIHLIYMLLYLFLPATGKYFLCKWHRNRTKGIFPENFFRSSYSVALSYTHYKTDLNPFSCIF